MQPLMQPLTRSRLCLMHRSRPCPPVLTKSSCPFASAQRQCASLGMSPRPCSGLCLLLPLFNALLAAGLRHMRLQRGISTGHRPRLARKRRPDICRDVQVSPAAAISALVQPMRLIGDAPCGSAPAFLTRTWVYAQRVALHHSLCRSHAVPDHPLPFLLQRVSHEAPGPCSWEIGILPCGRAPREQRTP